MPAPPKKASIRLYPALPFGGAFPGKVAWEAEVETRHPSLATGAPAPPLPRLLCKGGRARGVERGWGRPLGEPESEKGANRPCQPPAGQLRFAGEASCRLGGFRGCCYRALPRLGCGRCFSSEDERNPAASSSSYYYFYTTTWYYYSTTSLVACSFSQRSGRLRMLRGALSL